LSPKSKNDPISTNNNTTANIPNPTKKSRNLNPDKHTKDTKNNIWPIPNRPAPITKWSINRISPRHANTNPHIIDIKNGIFRLIFITLTTYQKLNAPHNTNSTLAIVLKIYGEHFMVKSNIAEIIINTAKITFPTILNLVFSIIFVLQNNLLFILIIFVVFFN